MDGHEKAPRGAGLFVQGAKAETMLRDFERLRQAIRSHDSFVPEEAWDRCERWVDQLRPVSAYLGPVMER